MPGDDTGRAACRAAEGRNHAFFATSPAAGGHVRIAQARPTVLLRGDAETDTGTPLTHPDFYYGFVSVVISWQVAFLIVSRDPLRYRLLLPALLLKKLLYPAATYVLYAQGRVQRSTFAVASVDFVWLVLFVAVWVQLRRSTAR